MRVFFSATPQAKCLYNGAVLHVSPLHEGSSRSFLYREGTATLVNHVKVFTIQLRLDEAPPLPPPNGDHRLRRLGKTACF